MNSIYSLDIEQLQERTGIRINVVESDIDLYYHMALSMYTLIEKNNHEGKMTVMILPVGPVFQYRRLITLLEYRPLDLSRLRLFFMDEYLNPVSETIISAENPLSFRGFIKRELSDPLKGKYGFNPDGISFPAPENPGKYDELIESLGGADLCHAGVGIVGHLAFNEPEPSGKMSLTEFKDLPSRIVGLTRETITINSNTALRGAFEEIPEKAVTVGMKSLMASRKFEIYMNRPWQAAVLRKALMLKPTGEFPVTCVQDHPNLSFTVTPEVSDVPELGLK